MLSLKKLIQKDPNQEHVLVKTVVKQANGCHPNKCYPNDQLGVLK